MLLPIYHQVIPSISCEKVNDITQMDLRWMEAIVKYLQIGKVSDDRKDLRCLNSLEP